MTINFAAAVRATAIAALIGGAALGLAGTAAATPSEAPAVHGTLYGDPTGAVQYWSEQNLDDCALMSTADVIGQLTGTLPGEDEIIQVASQTASTQHPGSIYFTPANLDDPNTGNGTDGEDVPVLLAQYGIDADYTAADVAADGGGPQTGMAALEKYLGNGQRVIAYVNAETIWGEDGHPDSSDHALVVTGVDTAQGIVHLNDSGTPDGADEQVSIAIFQQAWAAGDDAMVVTSAPA